ncbi:MAG: hypothetical protein JWL88_345 [Parcubacteria group bacterium]|nr:hypothetical protein [Parcubacteria group bacterium]
MSYAYVLHKMHDKYIAGSYKGESVPIRKRKLGQLINQICTVLGLEENSSVRISTRSLKHIYEGRTAAEYQLILDQLHLLIENPKEIYTNRPGKRGEYCFIGWLQDQEYICSIEIINKAEIEIVTVFEKRDQYLEPNRGCVLLWNWGDGTNSHRIANSNPQ